MLLKNIGLKWLRNRKLRESRFLELEAEGLLADAMKDVSSKRKIQMQLI